MAKVLTGCLHLILEYLGMEARSDSWLQVSIKQTLGGNGDDLGSWVPTIHMVDLDGVSALNFSH